MLLATNGESLLSLPRIFRKYSSWSLSPGFAELPSGVIGDALSDLYDMFSFGVSFSTSSTSFAFRWFLPLSAKFLGTGSFVEMPPDGLLSDIGPESLLLSGRVRIFLLESGVGSFESATITASRLVLFLLLLLLLLRGRGFMFKTWPLGNWKPFSILNRVVLFVVDDNW